MASPKHYTIDQLNKMSKKQMKKILKDSFGKADNELKLGHWNDAYRKLILQLQNNDSNNASNQSNKGTARKKKNKFVPHPGNDAFDKEKAKLKKQKEQKLQKKREKKIRVMILIIKKKKQVCLIT